MIPTGVSEDIYV